jgi:hypothetical protein
MTTRKPIAVLGAPSNLGLKPYADGNPCGVDRAPRVYRDLGLVEQLGARDLGDVQAPPYRDFERPDGGIRNDLALVVGRGGRAPLVREEDVVVPKDTKDNKDNKDDKDCKDIELFGLFLSLLSLQSLPSLLEPFLARRLLG